MWPILAAEKVGRCNFYLGLLGQNQGSMNKDGRKRISAVLSGRVIKLTDLRSLLTQQPPPSFQYLFLQFFSSHHWVSKVAHVWLKKVRRTQLLTLAHGSLGLHLLISGLSDFSSCGLHTSMKCAAWPSQAGLSKCSPTCGTAVLRASPFPLFLYLYFLSYKLK